MVEQSRVRLTVSSPAMLSVSSIRFFSALKTESHRRWKKTLGPCITMAIFTRGSFRHHLHNRIRELFDEAVFYLRATSTSRNTSPIVA